MIKRNAFGVGVARTAPGADALHATHAAASAAPHGVAAATDASVGST